MVIYGDILFALNAAMDYLLLLLSARAAGAPLRRGRFLAGATLGGIYAVALFLPGFSFLNGRFYQMVVGLLMLFVAFGTDRHFLKQSLLFLALTCALGGGVMAIGMMDGAELTLGQGIVYSVPDIKIILLSASVCYGVLSLVMPRLYRHTTLGGELSQVTFALEGRRVPLTALTDTGNTLTDPTTGRSVPVAEGEALMALFPVEYRPEARDLKDPVMGLARLNRGRGCGRFRLLAYRAVGIQRGLLLAVRVDRMVINKVEKRDVLVALSPTAVSDGGGYQVLVGGYET